MQGQTQKCTGIQQLHLFQSLKFVLKRHVKWLYLSIEPVEQSECRQLFCEGRWLFAQTLLELFTGIFVERDVK